MASREELIQRQRELEQVYDAAKAELMKIPNVLGVGIGIKEKGDELTPDIAFRVYVTEKKSPAELPPEDIVPKEIMGFKTDVIKVYSPKSRVFTEREETDEHRPLMGGIAISPDKSTYGTLGWFATLNGDASGDNIILTNKHVLYDDAQDIKTDVKKIGQAHYCDCCCCGCGHVADSIIGIKDSTVDCGLARVKSDVAVSRQIDNNKTTQRLIVTGSNAAVVGETVRKIGARSSFTTGVVIDVGAVAVPPATPTDPAGNPVTVMPNQILIRPADTETYEIENGKRAFSNYGDSGSVVVNDMDEIVGLLFSGDENSYSVDITFANNIQNVFDSLSTNGNAITLQITPAGERRASVRAKPQRAVAKSRIKFTDPEIQKFADEIVARKSASLPLELLERHRDEIVRLVNHRRVVMVTWQRKQGPAFLAAFARSVKVPTYSIPTEIEGISRLQALMSMVAALEEHASPALKADIQRYSVLVIQVLTQYDTVREMVEALEQSIMSLTVEEPVGA